MSGYHNYSMSNRAVAAYRNGLLPLSKIKAPAAFKKVAAELAGYEEWHHTSKMYNKTYFYCPKKIFGYVRELKKLDKKDAARALSIIFEKRKNRKIIREINPQQYRQHLADRDDWITRGHLRINPARGYWGKYTTEEIQDEAWLCEINAITCLRNKHLGKAA